MSSNLRVKAILAGLFLVFALVLASCAPPAGVEVTSARIQAWVGGPRDGVEVPMGQVPVLCHAFARAGVAQIELWVNGAFANRAVNAGETYFTAELSFQATGPGTYALVCLTGDQDGETVRSEPVTVMVSGELPTATTVPPAVDTATPTSTTVPPTAVPPPPPTVTLVPPTGTPIPPTVTPVPPTSTPTSTPTTPPPPIIVSFEVNPSTITLGGCPHFTWQVEGDITAIWFDGEGVGNYPDSRDRCPTATRAYELHAEGPGGTDTESVTVVVAQASPTPGDTDGPVITRIAESSNHMNWPDPQCYDCQYPNQVTITAYISDPSGVSGAKVTYRINAGGAVWRDIGMTQVQTGMYSATIGPADLVNSLNPPVPTGTCFTTSSLQYYVQAFDGLSNHSQSPTGAVTVHYCYIIR